MGLTMTGSFNSSVRIDGYADQYPWETQCARRQKSAVVARYGPKSFNSLQ